jgi:phosphoesterase RecJ-like protein
MKAKSNKRPKALRSPADNQYGEVIGVIQNHQSFLITTHENPDGDGLGAESALFLALRKMGKKVRVVNHDPLPQRFAYLPFRPYYHSSDRIPPHEVCFVLDAGDFSRIREGVRREEFSTLVNIDHHFSNDLFGDYNLVLPQASATGEIIHDLIRALKIKIDQPIAESLYTSLITDTGGFRYSNTTPKVLRMAADLVEAGVEAQKVSDQVFAGVSREAMDLIRRALGTIQTHEQDLVGSMVLTHADFKRSGAKEDDTDNLINFVRKLDKVQIAVFLKERPDRKIKLSLRGRNGANVATIAKRFGGGGHIYAAGATLPGPLSKALKVVLQACRTAVK